MKLLTLIVFVLAAAAANWLTSTYGLVYGVAAGTAAAGLVLLLRDALHELGGRWWVLGAIVAGTAASVLLAGPVLALASGAAFAVSELADAAVYTPLRRRGKLRAAAASGVVGSVVDSALFLWLAGFGFATLPAQVAVKVAVTLLCVGVVGALLRYRVGPARA